MTGGGGGGGRGGCLSIGCVCEDVCGAQDWNPSLLGGVSCGNPSFLEQCAQTAKLEWFRARGSGRQFLGPARG